MTADASGEMIAGAGGSSEAGDSARGESGSIRGLGRFSSTGVEGCDRSSLLGLLESKPVFEGSSLLNGASSG